GAGERGETVTTPARHVAILPTMLDAVEIAVPGDLPGHSLRRAVDRAGGGDRASYFEAMASMLEFGWAPLRGVVAGRDKYIDVPVPELYDLATDPEDMTNAIDRAPDRLRGFELLCAYFPVSLAVTHYLVGHE